MKLMRKYFMVLVALAVLLYLFVGRVSIGNNRIHIKLFGSQFARFYRDSSQCIENESSSNNKFVYLTKYPFYMSCKTNFSIIETTSDDYVNGFVASSAMLTSEPQMRRQLKQHDYGRAASRVRQTLRITRAIIVYFPIAQLETFEYEFRWLYRSWIEMQKYAPCKWRTDLVLFIDMNDKFHKMMSSDQLFLSGLNCSNGNRRKSSDDLPMCTLIDYKPLRDRQLNSYLRFDNEQHKYEHLLNDLDIFSDETSNLLPFYSFLKESVAYYSYLDSILMAFEGYSYFKEANYDFLIRTDMDVFLTPLFAKWSVIFIYLNLNFF